MSEKYEVRNMLFLDDDRKKNISIGKDKFIIRALFPKDRKEIARRMSVEQNGLPANSFSIDDRYMFERSAIIDQGMVESPDWWSNADECPDEDVLEFLYVEIMKWTAEFQEKLKKNRLNKRKPEEQVSG